MKLILENIGIIEKADIDINGLTVIAGNNDSGKSTIGKIAYSLTKSFEDYELNFEKEKKKKVEMYFRHLYISIRRDIDLKQNAELRKLMDKFQIVRRIDNKKLLELINKIKDFIDKDKIKLDPKIKEKLNVLFKEINKLFKGTESKNSKIIKSINQIFKSEFNNQINSVFTNESKISVLEGNNKIINLTIKDNDIQYDKSKKIDDIFPFDSSVFIETPFILTYKNAFEYSKSIYHVEDLLNRLKRPNIGDKDSILNIKQIINGDIYFDEDENNFLFRKNFGKKKIKINILNSASGIKSLGILQLLDKSGEFNKNLLLVIDEPEVHLHPDWQVEYAKLLIQLVKEGVKVLITSHSPYLIEALNKFSKKEKLGEEVKFYLSELNNTGKVIITDKTSNKECIFDKLSKPFERLIFEE